MGTDSLLAGDRAVGSVRLDVEPARAHPFGLSKMLITLAWSAFFGGIWWILAAMIDIPWWMRVGMLGLPCLALLLQPESRKPSDS